jgi:hypothetical protein
MVFMGLRPWLNPSLRLGYPVILIDPRESKGLAPQKYLPQRIKIKTETTDLLIILLPLFPDSPSQLGPSHATHQ